MRRLAQIIDPHRRTLPGLAAVLRVIEKYIAVARRVGRRHEGENYARVAAAIHFQVQRRKRRATVKTAGVFDLVDRGDTAVVGTASRGACLLNPGHVESCTRSHPRSDKIVIDSKRNRIHHSVIHLHAIGSSGANLLADFQIVEMAYHRVF